MTQPNLLHSKYVSQQDPSQVFRYHLIKLKTKKDLLESTRFTFFTLQMRRLKARNLLDLTKDMHWLECKAKARSVASAQAYKEPLYIQPL